MPFRALSTRHFALTLVTAAAIACALPAAPLTGHAGAAPSGMAPEVPGASPGPGEPDWPDLVARGDRFVALKATEGAGYTNPDFARHRAGATGAGLLVAAFHFARPDRSTGVAQADHFVANGGDWTADGHTLPGVLDLEWNPSGSPCYGLTAQAMVRWVRDFSDTYHARTGRRPMIYTPTTWWSRCTGDQGSFGRTNPLWATGSTAGLPFDWTTHTFRQDTTDGYRHYFNGTYAELRALAMDE